NRLRKEKLNQRSGVYGDSGGIEPVGFNNNDESQDKFDKEEELISAFADAASKVIRCFVNYYATPEEVAKYQSLIAKEIVNNHIREFAKDMGRQPDESDSNFYQRLLRYFKQEEPRP
ncbi:hypothetical protein E4U41_001002, partial [Claviceps citrina]